jgi:carbamoyltransferase
MIILGLNVNHGESSACIFKNGTLICAAEEERFVRVKACSHFPINAIKYCLSRANILFEEIDYVTHNSKFNYNIIPKIFFFFQYLFLNVKFFNLILSTFIKKRKIYKELELYFGKKSRFKIISVPHHISHVFSAIDFAQSNKKSLVFSFDGSGDFSTLESYLVNDNNIKLLDKNYFPNSLGFLYTAFSQYLGFINYGDEYKVMGLSAYGNPLYCEKILKLLKSSEPFKLNMKYFNIPKINYLSGKPVIEKLYNHKFIEIFGKERSISENENFIDQIYKDYAASIQKTFEDIVISYLSKLKKKYEIKKLFLTGGCALNGLLASKIVERKIFEDVKIGPNPGDGGGAIGSVLKFLWDQNLKSNLINTYPFIGPIYDDGYIEKHIINNIKKNNNYRIKFYKDFNDVASRAAVLIKEKKIIFWFQDGMEWGPRALGNRSILGDPSNKNIKDILNKKIKKRESFRPFAPAIMKEFANDYFYMQGLESPFMNIIFKAKEKTKHLFPDVVHIDGTSRVQTVSEKDNKKFYKLINEFYKITNCPILINTSLNINGPIAESPNDAFNFFLESGAKCIVLNNWTIELKK